MHIADFETENLGANAIVGEAFHRSRRGAGFKMQKRNRLP